MPVKTWRPKATWSGWICSGKPVWIFLTRPLTRTQKWTLLTLNQIDSELDYSSLSRTPSSLPEESSLKHPNLEPNKTRNTFRPEGICVWVLDKSMDEQIQTIIQARAHGYWVTKGSLNPKRLLKDDSGSEIIFEHNTDTLPCLDSNRHIGTPGGKIEQHQVNTLSSGLRLHGFKF